MLDETLKIANRRTVGVKQTLRALEKKNVLLVYIAKDAEKHVLSPVLEESQKQGVEVREVSTMKELGKGCGIEVGAAVAALLKE